MIEKQTTAHFDPGFFPQQVVLVTVEKNMLPMGYWTVVSKSPFRFLICMGVGNYSLGLLKKRKEAAIHFMPWSMRQQVAAAGFSSGRDVNKAELLGFELAPAEKLQHTWLIAGAEVIYETTVYMELPNLSREFSPFVLDVVAVHRTIHPTDRQPIFYLTEEDFAARGEGWQYKK